VEILKLLLEGLNDSGVVQRGCVVPVRYLLEERRTSRKNLIELGSRRTFQMHVDFQPAVSRSSTRMVTAVCTSLFTLRQASFRYCMFVSLDELQSFI